MGKVLVNIYTPGYQYLQTFAVSCQYKVERVAQRQSVSCLIDKTGHTS